jgi:hypothetical protein
MLYELNVALVAFSTNDLLVSEVVATTRTALSGLFRLRGALQHPHSSLCGRGNQLRPSITDLP